MGTYKLQDSRKKLWNGAILGTIAHAIWVAHNPELAYLQSWDGINYNVQDYAGSFGTVTFSEKYIVAVFFDVHSARNPFRVKGNYEPLSFFKEAPDAVVSLARDEALQYMLQEYEGIDRPIITAAFWSEEQDLVAAEPWHDVFNNGAHLVRIQLLETDDAIEEWQSTYELSPAQVDLVTSLFFRKMNQPNTLIVLDDQEKRIIVNGDATGVAESRRLLESIGIILP